MCAHSWETMVCIDIQGALAVVPWMPMMAGTLATLLVGQISARRPAVRRGSMIKSCNDGSRSYQVDLAHHEFPRATAGRTGRAAVSESAGLSRRRLAAVRHLGFSWPLPYA
jgi:hypothetical protein